MGISAYRNVAHMTRIMNRTLIDEGGMFTIVVKWQHVFLSAVLKYPWYRVYILSETPYSLNIAQQFSICVCFLLFIEHKDSSQSSRNGSRVNRAPTVDTLKFSDEMVLWCRCIQRVRTACIMLLPRQPTGSQMI